MKKILIIALSFALMTTVVVYAKETKVTENKKSTVVCVNKVIKEPTQAPDVKVVPQDDSIAKNLPYYGEEINIITLPYYGEDVSVITLPYVEDNAEVITVKPADEGGQSK